MSQKMKTKQYESIDVETIVNELLAESLQGWHKELWYHKDTKKFTFSGWMTQNSWNESNDDDDIHVYSFDAIHLTDNDELASIDIFSDVDTEGLDEQTIQNIEKFYRCYDGNEEINKDFPLINQKEKILFDLEQYSILNESEAIDALINIVDAGGWYEDAFEAIWKVENDIQEENEEN
jgi:hypothetical protein